ncbi:hypothetical protein LINPERHAP1_LOCUS19604, partial [Linum perenne]
KFRNWASCNWGCSLKAPIHKLDDDLWLLFCDSQAKVERILSLNRTSFNGVPILLDKWIPEAGLSKVLEEDGVIWITIRGIPIHLRSTDLFRQLGSECGEFMGFEVCSSLSSVRLRIKPTNSLPNEISVKHGDSLFTVRVILDQSAASPTRVLPSGIQPDLLSVGKAVLSPIPSYRFGSPAVLELGSSSASPQSVSETSIQPNSPFCLLADVPSPEFSEIRQIEASPPTCVLDKAPTTFVSGSLFVGLSLDFKDKLWLVRSNGLNRTPLVKFSLSGGNKGLGLLQVGTGFSSSSLLGPLKLAHTLGPIPLLEFSKEKEPQLRTGCSSLSVLASQ